MTQASSASYVITYKSGQVMGKVAKDVISLTSSPITLMNQTFGLTDNGTLDFTRASCDGIFVRPPFPVVALSLLRCWAFMSVADASSTPCTASNCRATSQCCRLHACSSGACAGGLARRG
jgi:hypothetical protein